MDMTDETAPDRRAAIEYHGVAGATAECESAVFRQLLCEPVMARAVILTSGRDHALLLFTEVGDPIAIKSGFASGYGGTGPTGFSRVLQFLYGHGVEIEEMDVSEDVIERLDRAALTAADLDALENGKPVRPSRWGDYILKREQDAWFDKTLWRTLPSVMPYAILDPRLIDLALKFESDPDACLSRGYRQLEDKVRERTGLKELFGAKLFSKAFQGEDALLTWDVDDKGEIQGRGSLFAAVFMAYRNPRAHRMPASGDPLSEFLLLNQLFKLEAEAVVRARSGHHSPIRDD